MSKNIRKVSIIMTGFSCNNNCAVCSVKPFSKNHADNRTEEILRLMEEKRVAGADVIEFTGGEPTIRRDILFLIGEAKKLGYDRVALSTNGRAFSHKPFLEKALEAGLNRVTVTMDGPTEKVHDTITRTPGSFIQTERGILNLIAAGVDEVVVNTVLCKLNSGHIGNMADKLNELGVSVWGILDLIPDGNIIPAYNAFCLSFQEIRGALMTAYSRIDNFRSISFFDFSACVIPREMFLDQRIVLFDAFNRSNFLDQAGYDPKRFSVDGEVYSDEHKTRLGGCLRCEKMEKCAGVWRRHLDVFGEEDEIFVSANKF